MLRDFHGRLTVVPSVSMSALPVELRVGGQTYRVTSSAGEGELQRLAGVLDDRLRRFVGSRAVPQNALLLVAMELAHELEEERDRRGKVETRAKEMFRTLLTRIDAALEETEPPAASIDDSDVVGPPLDP
jgi:cell division protein ZapA